MSVNYDSDFKKIPYTCFKIINGRFRYATNLKYKFMEIDAFLQDLCYFRLADYHKHIWQIGFEFLFDLSTIVSVNFVTIPNITSIQELRKQLQNMCLTSAFFSFSFSFQIDHTMNK